MRVAVFGATGRIGRHVIDQLLQGGHEVVALVRDPRRLPVRHERLRVVQGDARDADRVREVISGADAVISALGPRRNTPEEAEAHLAAVRTILQVMRELGVRRFITVLGAAVDAPTDRKGILDRIAAWLVRRAARWVYEAKRGEFELLQQSGLEWVAARPPMVTEGPITLRYEVRLDRPRRPRVTAADVAHFLTEQVQSDRYLRSAPFVA